MTHRGRSCTRPHRGRSSACRGSLRWASSRLPPVRWRAPDGRCGGRGAGASATAVTPCSGACAAPRASSNRTSASSSVGPARPISSTSSASASAGSGRCPRRSVSVVEVGGVERGADLVDALEVARDPSQGDELVVLREVARPRRAQARDQVPVRSRVPRRPRRRQFDRRQLVAADLGDRLERPARAVHVPREVRDPIRPRHRVGERRPDGDHRRSRCTARCGTRRRRGRAATPVTSSYARRDLSEVADVLDRVADAQRGEIHHRVADVRVLEVEQTGDAVVVEHELERVVR